MDSGASTASDCTLGLLVVKRARPGQAPTRVPAHCTGPEAVECGEMGPEASLSDDKEDLEGRRNTSASCPAKVGSAHSKHRFLPPV